MENFTLKEVNEGTERGIEVQLYYSFKLDVRWGWVIKPRPGHYTPRKDTQYPLYMRLGEPKVCSAWVQKILPAPGFIPRPIHPVASHCTDSVIPAHRFLLCRTWICL